MHLLIFSEPFQTMFFHKINCLIENHGHDTENDNGHENHVKLEHLTSINNQIPQPLPASNEFSDNDSHKTESDVYLHGIDENRNRAWENDFFQYVPPAAAQGVDELDFLRVHLGKSGINGKNAAKHGHGHSSHNDGFHIGPQPYDEKRSQGGFRQTVQYYQIRLQDLGKAAKEPEQNGGQQA